MFFSQKSRAVISVFLIITMMPLLGLAVVLVDGSRMRTAEMMVQEAGDLAAMSALANYNNDLKNDYGLFAINDAESAKNTYETYLRNSLKAVIGGNDEYSNKIYDAVKDAVFTGTSINGFTNLFDYDIGSTKFDTLFTLDQKDVLQNQIVEYTKYRGIYFMADRLSLLTKFSEIKNQYEDTKNSADVMEEKLSLDQEGSKNIDEKVAALGAKIDKFHTAMKNAAESGLVSSFKDNMRTAIDSAEEEYDENIDNADWPQDKPVAYSLRTERIISTLETNAYELDELTKEANDAFLEISRDEVVGLISNIDSHIGKLNDLKNNKVENSGASVKDEMEKDIETSINRYNKMKEQLNTVLSYLDSSQYQEDKKNLNTAKNMWSNTFEAYYNSLDDENNQPLKLKTVSVNSDGEETTEADNYRYIKVSVQSNGERKADTPKVYISENEARSNYYGTQNDGCPYYVKKCDEIRNRLKSITLNESSETNDTRDKVENIIEEGNNNTDSYTGKSIPDSEYALLPSANESVISEDMPEISSDTDQIAEDTKGLLSGAVSYLSGIAETTRDEALTFSYIFGMFKTRMSSDTDFTSASKPSVMEDYHVKWRYENDDGERDLRERPKSSLDTVLNAEVEYIFGGNKSDTLNCAAVYAWIYSTRLANNIAAIYASDARKQCYNWALATSAAIYSASLFTIYISPTLLQWIYITAWAVLETGVEMSFLINDGYRIPLIKTNKNLIVDDIFSVGDTNNSLKQSVKNSFINVCYEEYLLILMCLFTDSETRVKRTGDLIQLNMRLRHGGDFMLNKAATYLRAETDVNINYLFNNVKQFSGFYTGNGIRIKNIIYQGY